MDQSGVVLEGQWTADHLGREDFVRGWELVADIVVGHCGRHSEHAGVMPSWRPERCLAKQVCRRKRMSKRGRFPLKNPRHAVQLQMLQQC